MEEIVIVKLFFQNLKIKNGLYKPFFFLILLTSEAVEWLICYVAIDKIQKIEIMRKQKMAQLSHGNRK